MKSLSITLLCLLVTNFIFAQEAPTKSQESPKKETETSPEKTNELKEVTVYGNKKQFLKIESDKTIVSVKNNPMLSTGNAYDAVKKLPGVIASPTGGLSLNGKGVSIYIDGAPSTLSGSDLENYLSSLPANAIEKVELIYNPGAAYDANSSGSIINIVTSSKKMKGVNASFNINYNFNKYQKPSPQILLNGKEKNLSWQTMLGYNYIDREERSVNGQTFTWFNPDKNILQDKLTVTTNRNLYFRAGTNYKLNSNSNLLFNYNSNYGNDREVFDAKTTGTDIPDYMNSGVSKIKNSNHEISLQYKTKLDTIGRTLDITAFSNFFNRNPITNSNAVEDNVASYNNGNIDFGLVNYYLKYDFSIPFEKLKFTLNTGGKFNVIKVNDTGKYNLNNPVADVVDFDYTENNLAFYVEGRKKIKKFNLTAGLRFEDFKVDRYASTATEKINYKNTNFFPNVSVLYEATSDINVSGSYSRKISQPNYGSLDPNSSTFDQYNTAIGNPFLKPTFFDNFELKATAFQFVQLGANYTVAKDHNLFILNAADGEFVSNQTFQQFDQFKTFSAYFNFPIPLDYIFKGKAEFEKRMNTMDKMNYIFFNINYIKSLTEGYNFSFKNRPIWNYAAQAQIMLPWNITNSMTYYILPEGNWEIYHVTKAIQQFDISFNRDFMNKKLKLGFHVFDVFNSNEINAVISSTNLQTKFYRKEDTRTFRISLTYNFGNLKLQNESTNIETEKVKSGGGFGK